MPSKKKLVVVIEDEADILDVIAYNLTREGFDVKGCLDGEEGLKTVNNYYPDLVIIDLMLPGIDGIEICRRMKEDSSTRNIPVIMVTAKGEESDVVLGLGVGADDYIPKPFKPRELVARVKAVMRRGPLADELMAAGKVVQGSLIIDPARHEVLVEGTSAPCTATQFRLLHFMAAHPGRVFTREELLSHAIGDDVLVMERNIDVHIRAIRKVLGEHARMIETIRGVGYRFSDKGGSKVTR